MKMRFRRNQLHAAVQEKERHEAQVSHSGARGPIATATPVTEYHTVERKTSADHAVAEFQRQKTVFGVSASRCCKLRDRGVRGHLPRTDDHAVAQYYVVVLEVSGRPREW